MGMAYDNEELYKQQLKQQQKSEVTRLERELTAARDEAERLRGG